ncbi:hypothetical protein BISU_0015 [Bifidobacterium subtile]|uniref:Uncharacterized protein n=2 Tax=Bifidobacterium TaxID=1678 RepID=A0A087E6Z5_9BIFI|nr:hypothetical protein BISU_0015 [Bifidobacterium subtile]
MLNNAIEYVRVKHAVRKYGSDFSLFFTKASQGEIELLLLYTARKANDRQRELIHRADAKAIV